MARFDRAACRGRSTESAAKCDLQSLPPTDGVLWVQKSDGIYAEKVLPGLAASRAGISPGDKLIGIGLDGETSKR